MAEEEEGVVDLVEGVCRMRKSFYINHDFIFFVLRFKMIGKSKILHTQTLLPIKIAGLV